MTPSVSPDLNILDESLDENRAHSCRLSILVSPGQISLVVMDIQQTRYLAAQIFRFPEPSGADDFSRLLREITATDVLSWHFRDVRIYVSNRLYTLVPAPLFDPSLKESYLKFNLSGLPGDAVYLNDRLTAMDAMSVYAVPRWLKEQLTATFGPAPLHHAISPWIESILMGYKYTVSDPVAFIHIQAGLFDLLILGPHSVNFCNSFLYKTAEDVLYYTMFVLEQLQCAPEQLVLHVMGEVGKNAPVIEQLGAYIPRLDFASRNPSFSYSNPFDEIPGHYFFNLLNAVQCEL
ncbi:MAG: DUF3822 family protein [Bacteroidales bacterium]|nr:DUF3822 family protein [Lentimicrobiaceae bacterium]MDD5695785.1 DUF3822 family protein [Bacteroidales bacterium]